MLRAVTRRRRRFRRHTTADAHDAAQISALYFEQLWAVEDVASELSLTGQAVIDAIRAMGEAPLATASASTMCSAPTWRTSETHQSCRRHLRRRPIGETSSAVEDTSRASRRGRRVRAIAWE